MSLYKPQQRHITIRNRDLHFVSYEEHPADARGIAQKVVDKAVAAGPDVAVFQEIRGLHLELGGKPDEARQAYARALYTDARAAALRLISMATGALAPGRSSPP